MLQIVNEARVTILSHVNIRQVVINRIEIVSM